MFKKARFNRICKRIKEIKIQGATNVAKSALKAYYLFPSKSTKAKLLKLRPTEPMLSHVLQLAEKQPKSKILSHFPEAQIKINKQVYRLIKNSDVIFTHCHSTNVVKALMYSKKKSKKFEVYNTETRPLYQGRRTAKELKHAGIKVTQFIDSAAGIALSNEQGTKKPDKVFLGADALLKDSVINKVGSETIAKLAYINKIPVYIIADSWKYAHNQKIPLENRELNEVWDRAPKNIKIKNPAFESIDKKYIKAIISDISTKPQPYNQFLKKVKNK